MRIRPGFAATPLILLVTLRLGYQSTSFHDALAMRDLFGRRPAPEFAAWLERQGLVDGENRIRPHTMPSRFPLLLPA